MSETNETTHRDRVRETFRPELELRMTLENLPPARGEWQGRLRDVCRDWVSMVAGQLYSEGKLAEPGMEMSREERAAWASASLIVAEVCGRLEALLLAEKLEAEAVARARDKVEELEAYDHVFGPLAIGRALGSLHSGLHALQGDMRLAEKRERDAAEVIVRVLDHDPKDPRRVWGPEHAQRYPSLARDREDVAAVLRAELTSKGRIGAEVLGRWVGEHPGLDHALDVLRELPAAGGWRFATHKADGLVNPMLPQEVRAYREAHGGALPDGIAMWWVSQCSPGCLPWCRPLAMASATLDAGLARAFAASSDTGIRQALEQQANAEFALAAQQAQQALGPDCFGGSDDHEANETGWDRYASQPRSAIAFNGVSTLDARRSTASSSLSINSYQQRESVQPQTLADRLLATLDTSSMSFDPVPINPAGPAYLRGRSLDTEPRADEIVLLVHEPDGCRVLVVDTSPLTLPGVAFGPGEHVDVDDAIVRLREFGFELDGTASEAAAALRWLGGYVLHTRRAGRLEAGPTVSVYSVPVQLVNRAQGPDPKLTKWVPLDEVCKSSHEPVAIAARFIRDSLVESHEAFYGVRHLRHRVRSYGGSSLLELEVLDACKRWVGATQPALMRTTMIMSDRAHELRKLVSEVDTRLLGLLGHGESGMRTYQVEAMIECLHTRPRLLDSGDAAVDAADDVISHAVDDLREALVIAVTSERDAIARTKGAVAGLYKRRFEITPTQIEAAIREEAEQLAEDRKILGAPEHEVDEALRAVARDPEKVAAHGQELIGHLLRQHSEGEDPAGCKGCKHASFRYNGGQGATTCALLDDLVVGTGPMPQERPSNCPLPKRVEPSERVACSVPGCTGTYTPNPELDELLDDTYRALKRLGLLDGLQIEHPESMCDACRAARYLAPMANAHVEPENWDRAAPWKPLDHAWVIVHVVRARSEAQEAGDLHCYRYDPSTIDKVLAETVVACDNDMLDTGFVATLLVQPGERPEFTPKVKADAQPELEATLLASKPKTAGVWLWVGLIREQREAGCWILILPASLTSNESEAGGRPQRINPYTPAQTVAKAVHRACIHARSEELTRRLPERERTCACPTPSAPGHYWARKPGWSEWSGRTQGWERMPWGSPGDLVVEVIDDSHPRYVLADGEMEWWDAELEELRSLDKGIIWGPRVTAPAEVEEVEQMYISHGRRICGALGIMPNSTIDAAVTRINELLYMLGQRNTDF